MSRSDNSSAFYRPMGNWLAILLAPAVLVVIAFFVIPMTAIAINAFSTVEAGAAVFSLANYHKIVTDGFHWEVLFRTVRVAAFTMIAALIVSYPAALYLLFSDSKWRQHFLIIAISPLFISVVGSATCWRR